MADTIQQELEKKITALDLEKTQLLKDVSVMTAQVNARSGADLGELSAEIKVMEARIAQLEQALGVLTSKTHLAQDGEALQTEVWTYRDAGIEFFKTLNVDEAQWKNLVS